DLSAPPREPASVMAAPEAELRLSNLDKVFWPEDGFTKGDLLKYYEAIWPSIAIYLHDRPVVLTRYPDGIHGKSFFQKNAPHFTTTSGQDGLHILFPLNAALTHQEARAFAEVLARAVVAVHPDVATVARPLQDRGGRVYVDYLQNGYGKTIAAPFSARPRA